MPLRRSLARRLANGSQRDFPTYNDLVQYLVNEGEIASPDDLLGRDRDKLSGIFFHWIRQGQLACQFAIKLANQAVEDPEPLCWVSRVAVPPIDPELVQELQEFLTTDGQGAEAVQIIFEHVTTPEDVVRLINTLCAHPAWNWREIRCPDCRDSFAVGLRWRLPASRLENWVLGFTPYPETPFTRWIKGAPFTVLAMRTLPVSSNSFFPVGSEGAVHLANMPLRLPCPIHVFTDKLDEKSQENRTQLLAGELCGAAKARVTFCLPARVRPLLEKSGEQPLRERARRHLGAMVRKRLRGWLRP